MIQAASIKVFVKKVITFPRKISNQQNMPNKDSSDSRKIRRKIFYGIGETMCELKDALITKIHSKISCTK